MLTAVQIKAAKPAAKAYKLADSGGLFLLVTPGGQKYWRYKFRMGGVEGLKREQGSFGAVMRQRRA